MSPVPPALVSPTLCHLTQNSPFPGSISAVEFVLMLSNSVSIRLCLCLLYFMCRAEGRCQPQQQSQQKMEARMAFESKCASATPLQRPHTTLVSSAISMPQLLTVHCGGSAHVCSLLHAGGSVKIPYRYNQVKNPSLVSIDGVLIKRCVYGREQGAWCPGHV